jgi:hypothetical protein
MNSIFGDDDDDSDLDDDHDDNHDDSDLDDDHDDSDLDDDDHEEDSPAIVNPTLRSSLLGRLQRSGISLHPCKFPECAAKCGDYVGQPYTGAVCTNCQHLRENHGSFGL